jgi:tRNA nucleotidyltransferase (CCA-adding enzyme)
VRDAARHDAGTGRSTVLTVPVGVQEIVRRLEAHGFETWCVGGAVRDALLGHPDLDWDIATAATPDEVERLFRRTVPLGIRFGTVGVFDRSGRLHEVTTFRSDVETDGRHAVVRFGATLDEDLARRDFTINAIAYSPTRGVVHDPFDGRGDLTRKVIRTVGTARDRMVEDRLRALRGIRFAARFGFTIEASTWDAIGESAPHLRRLSPERVRQELEKTMEQVAAPSWALERWEESGAMATLIPALVGVSAITRSALDYLPRPGPSGRRAERRVNRMTALFLDVPEGRLGGILRELRFSNSDAKVIGEIVRRWQTLGAEMGRDLVVAPVSQRKAREWVARSGRTRLHALMRIAHAVWCARRAAGEPAPSPARVRTAYRALRTAARGPVEIADLAVDGEDLAGAGIPPGPEVGKILRTLLGMVLEDPARNTREELLAAARALSRSPESKE